MTRVLAYLPGATSAEQTLISRQVDRRLDLIVTTPGTAGLRRVLDAAQPGDVLVVRTLADVGATPLTFLRTAIPLLDRAAGLRVLDAKLTIRPADAPLLRTLQALFSAGHRRGPRPALDADELTQVQRRLDEGGATVSQIASEYGLNPKSLYRLLARHRQSHSPEPPRTSS